ncbi:hypothetical protein HY382_00825 [Candidatus Curtissbacteria bacterium]|nr:hypothetical protein [Candidatus Curtissbacteria bacterium]
MDDPGGILSAIGDVIGEAASVVADEAKKFGGSATGQVTGSQPVVQDPLDKSPLSGLTGFGKSLTSQITGGSSDSTTTIGDLSAKDEAANFGKSIISQITGSKHSGGQPVDSNKHSKYQYSLSGELSKLAKGTTSQVSGKVQSVGEMAKADDEFSKREAEAVKLKIAKIYEEHAARRKREEEARRQEVLQKEQQKKQIDTQALEQKKQDFVNPAVAKTRAEIKNFGAE